MMQLNYREVVEFWFETLSPKDWFNGGPTVDDSIRERFESWIDPVYKGEVDGWLDDPEGVLAAILVLDQFPRNVYRGEPRAFAYDDVALRLSVDGIRNGWDKSLTGDQRAFFYLPLEHSEKMTMQDLSVASFAGLVLDTPEEERSRFRDYLNYAWRHYVIIRDFDRYPHRNDILGRESTPRERKFLTKPGSSFL